MPQPAALFISVETCPRKSKWGESNCLIVSKHCITNRCKNWWGLSLWLASYLCNNDIRLPPVKEYPIAISICIWLLEPHALSSTLKFGALLWCVDLFVLCPTSHPYLAPGCTLNTPNQCCTIRSFSWGPQAWGFHYYLKFHYSCVVMWLWWKM